MKTSVRYYLGDDAGNPPVDAVVMSAEEPRDGRLFGGTMLLFIPGTDSREDRIVIAMQGVNGVYVAGLEIVVPLENLADAWAKWKMAVLHLRPRDEDTDWQTIVKTDRLDLCFDGKQIFVAGKFGGRICDAPISPYGVAERLQVLLEARHFESSCLENLALPSPLVPSVGNGRSTELDERPQ